MTIWLWRKNTLKEVYWLNGDSIEDLIGQADNLTLGFAYSYSRSIVSIDRPQQLEACVAKAQNNTLKSFDYYYYYFYI